MSTTDSITEQELEAFNTIVTTLGRLSPDSRSHVWRTVGHFFHLASDSAIPLTVPHRIDTGPTTTATIQAQHFSEDRSPSPKQFLLEKKPRTDVDRVVCLAYYLAHYRGQTEFKTVDLSLLNTEAAQVKFSNAAQTVENATKTGLLVPTTKGAKQLSALGEVYVAGLPDYERAREALREHRPYRKQR